ncbi:hypothetical protein CS063_09915 [Sporanaerobium hydrogeniformans]|uniref:Uncharacterized protein n=1 Tax=Sporanaerobium hydrogeniformans TaxID=3072179 RepID=A0AC61DC51_9FIRM|nr:SseB family protein [Sporanaerobium hydrogeniformans]PHV70608.1 hypothetical protein CS063_09915 [Sporanaerobium hydrogeniformans]
MPNFYDLNPHHKPNTSSTSPSISLELNTSLTNENFYKYLEAYLQLPSEETQNVLGAYLNKMSYLIAIIPDTASHNNTLTLTLGDEFQLLICYNENREVFLPIFTDDKALKDWYKAPIHTLTVPAEWLWRFILRSKNYAGIIINPDTISWSINLEQIQSLLDDIK